MTNDQRPEKFNGNSRVDKTDVDGKTLTADEILALAGRHLQEKRNLGPKTTRKSRSHATIPQPTEQEILAIKEKIFVHGKNYKRNLICRFQNNYLLLIAL